MWSCHSSRSGRNHPPPLPLDSGFRSVRSISELRECLTRDGQKIRLEPGQYRVSLLRTFKDGFYPGLHQLPDGTMIATTYANYREEDVGCSIVSVRFKISEIESMAKAGTTSAAP